MGAAPDLRQAEATVYARRRRRRARSSQAVVAVLAVAAAFLGRRIASALAAPGPLAVDAAVYAWAGIAALWLAGLPFAVAGWRDAYTAPNQFFPPLFPPLRRNGLDVQVTPPIVFSTTWHYPLRPETALFVFPS